MPNKPNKPKATDERNKMMERVAAARAYLNTLGAQEARDNAELEAFMAIFHPEKAADRAFMHRLKGND